MIHYFSTCMRGKCVNIDRGPRKIMHGVSISLVASNHKMKTPQRKYYTSCPFNECLQGYLANSRDKEERDHVKRYHQQVTETIGIIGAVFSFRREPSRKTNMFAYATASSQTRSLSGTMSRVDPPDLKVHVTRLSRCLKTLSPTTPFAMTKKSRSTIGQKDHGQQDHCLCRRCHPAKTTISRSCLTSL